MRLLYYGILLPFSKFSPRAMHRIANVVSWVLRDVIKYRKAIIEENLARSFPEKTASERREIETQYYHYLGDIVMESISLLSITKERVQESYVCDNPEVVEAFFDKGQSVILVSAHYNNWEYMVLSLGMQFRHHGIGVGKELSNKWLDRRINARRQRFGTEVVFADTVRETFERYRAEQRVCAYMMLFDQSPNNIKKCYWTNFLHQDTPFIYGPEYFAKKYDYPIFYYHVYRVARGKYRFNLELIEAKPNESPYTAILQSCVDCLESDLQRAPTYWLWSHRRWKHKRGEVL